MAGSKSGCEADNLIARYDDAPFAIVNGVPVSVSRLTEDVVHCASSLPDSDYVIDLCDERYQFTVRFLAVLMLAKVNLLPSQRDANGLGVLRQAFPNTALMTNPTSIDNPLTPTADVCNERLHSAVHPHGTAAIAFTSGTTGTPQPHPKSWRMLDAFRRVHLRYLTGWLEAATHKTDIGLVATVPPWHMYGLEWSLMLPTIAPITLYCGDVLCPKDIAAALDQFETPTVLVTTPTHLRAILKGPAPVRPVAITICATAPLDSTLSEMAERHLRTQVIDLYGCSEAGSLATRRPTTDPVWTFFDCFDLDFDDGRLTVDADFLPNSVTLPDSFVAFGTGRFRLEGRATDMVKIGGKRESLAKLNTLLLSIPGVEDGLVYQPEAIGLPGTGRLAAILVAPTLNASSIRSQLTKSTDPAFIPRPIRFVDALPRQTSSKFSAGALRALLEQV